AFQRIYPDLFGQLQTAITNGVAEVSGGFFVQSDLNLLSGESIVRQTIYGQQYLQTTFGRRARSAWNIDAFGHPNQMPQIALKGGMSDYALGRGIGNVAAIGGTEFYWDAPDGSRVQAHFLANSYVDGGSIGATAATDADISEVFQREQGTSNAPAALLGL